MAPIEFSQIFYGFCRVDYKKVLSKYSRNRIIRLAVLLNKEYCGKPALKICQMLSPDDPKRLKLMRRIEKFCNKRTKFDVEYVAGLEITTLELLRLAYSIPYEEFNNSEKLGNVDKLQLQTIKLITQINERIMKYKIDKKHKRDLAALLYTNSASTYDILYYNKQNEYLIQVIQAVLFFKLLENNPKYDELMKEFYKQFNISNWREYLRTLVSVFTISYNNEGAIPANLDIDIDSLMTKSVLDKISIPFSYPYIPYSNKDEFDMEGNSDYRIFRDKPLLKAANGDYYVHSRPLLTDRIYSSLYFDFKRIAEQLKTKQPDISNLFTSEFIEKTLFVGLMKECMAPDTIDAYDENDLKRIYKTKNMELGYPDYFVKTNDAVFLFECKDIRLNSWIKEQHDYSVLEKEIRNKLVSKTYQLDSINHCHRSVPPKRIGCGQIAGHLANIRKGAFPWDNSLSHNIKVYPILIIADNRLLAPGLANLLQRWYRECLCNEGLQTSKEYPLTIMSPLTLIKYSDRFKKDGIKKYCDEYFESISIEPDDAVSAYNKKISFDDYMTQYPFKLKELGNQFIKELMADRNMGYNDFEE